MNRRGFLAAGTAALASPAWTQSPDDAFQAFVAAAEQRASAAGVSAATLAQAREGLAYNPNLVRPAGADPESRRVGRYVQALLSGDGQRARAKRAANPRMAEIEVRYGVPASVLTAFWGRESSYGADFGRLDVFSTLASMGVAGRGSTDWTGEYVCALRIVERGDRSRDQLRGSGAGALGHTQLMPSSFLTYGDDFDADGKVDVWNASPLDALASAARHIQDAPVAGPPLPAEGRAWQRGRGWIVPVTLPPGFDLAQVEVEETALTSTQWSALGVRADEPWSDLDREQPAKLALPAGIGGPALLLLPNYDVFERYNPSRTYALGVGLLARLIEGRPSVAWPDEAPLSLSERQSAQQGLQRMGLYPGPIDGDLGSGSRRAIRRWQRDHGLTADGYLTTQVVQALTPTSPA
ncbi:MAG: lytic murein transglycosylase [Caulobacteraceae bacterium]|nr:lytic murein transglycosylase [Caulobacteraceae bacterium]